MMYLRPIMYLSPLEEYMLPCLTKGIFGVDCPGCGLQRAVALLFEGEFVAAFQMYPAIYALIPLFALILASKLFRLKVDQRPIIVLSIASVALILLNFLIKIIH